MHEQQRGERKRDFAAPLSHKFASPIRANFPALKTACSPPCSGKDWGICSSLPPLTKSSNRLKTEKFVMPDTNGTRISIPVSGKSGKVSEEELKRYSFDLVHFPMYLSQRVAPRVRIEITDDHRGDHDLMACYEDGQHTRTWKYASLIADDDGCLTGSVDFYRMVHEAFGAHADGLTYIGFTRGGLPVYAPLFVLAMLYKKYGKGIYKAGQSLPTPCPELTAGVLYTFSVR